MSAGPQLDGSDGGDTGEISDTGRQDRVNDAVAEFERDRQSVDGRIQVADMEPEPTRQIGTADAGPQLDGGFEGTERETDTDRTADTPQRDPSPGPTPEDLIEPAPSEPVDQGGELEQGIEESGATEGVERQAQDFEQEVLAENPGLTERDVSVSLIGSQAGPTFQAAFTEGAEARVRDRLRNIAAGLGLGPGSLAATGGTDSAAETQAEQRAERRAALEGIGAFDELAEQEQEALDAIEAQLERAIGEQRAATFGAVDPAQTRQIIERTDLERGKDFTIETGEEETRTFTDPETGEQVTETVTPLEATLTEDFERKFLNDLVGFKLTRRFGTEFEPEEDFTLNETDDEGFEPLLTNAGRAKAQTQNIRRTVADFEAQVFGVGDTQFQFDIPGEGALLTESDPDRDLGQVDVPVRMGPEDQFTTFEAVLEDVEKDFLEATEQQEAAVLADDSAARGRAGTALRTERRNFETGAGTKPVQQFSQSALRGIPLFVTGAVGLAKDAGEFGYSVGEAAVLGDFERVDNLVGNLAAAGTEQAVLTADTAAEDPGGFAARGLGSAAASLPLFGAAAAIGPRASFLTRYGIQPGEELLGAGLNYGARGVGRIVGRPDAGRRVAETIAPNKEPVFFSEEAFIRGVRGVSRRTQNLLAEGRETLARVRVEPRVGAGIVPPKFELEGEGDTRFMEEELREAERAALNRRAEARAEERIKREREARRRRKPDSEPFVAERTSGREYNPDRPGGDFRGSQARRQGQKQRLRQRAAEQRRQKAQQRFTEVEEETLDRVQEAEAPTVDIEEDATPLGQMRRAETAIEGQVLDEAMARRVAAEASEIQELEQTGRVVGERPRTAIDSRLNELLETATDTEQRLDLDQRLELRTELEQRLEGRSELRSRIETRGEGDPVRQEVREEVEAEAETETKTETRIEQRQETRAEVNLGDGRFFEDEEELLDDWFGDETFGSGIAGEGEAALENIEQELVEGFEEGEAGTAELEDFEDAERDILEG